MPTVEYLNYDVVDDKGWDMYDEEVFENTVIAEDGQEFRISPHRPEDG